MSSCHGLIREIFHLWYWWCLFFLRNPDSNLKFIFVQSFSERACFNIPDSCFASFHEPSFLYEIRRKDACFKLILWFASCVRKFSALLELKTLNFLTLKFTLQKVWFNQEDQVLQMQMKVTEGITVEDGWDDIISSEFSAGGATLRRRKMLQNERTWHISFRAQSIFTLANSRALLFESRICSTWEEISMPHWQCAGNWKSKLLKRVQQNRVHRWNS